MSVKENQLEKKRSWLWKDRRSCERKLAESLQNTLHFSYELQLRLNIKNGCFKIPIGLK